MSMFVRSDKTSDGAPAAKAAEPAAGPGRDDGKRATTRSGPPVPSLIGAGLRVKGDLESAGEIKVDGEVEGDVRGKSVLIGEGAIVKGSIFGDTVTVSGTIEGKVEAMAVTVESTAKLTGDIIHETVKIEQGAYVDGRCSPHFGKTQARPAIMPPAASASASRPGEADKTAKGEKAEEPAKVH